MTTAKYQVAKAPSLDELKGAHQHIDRQRPPRVTFTLKSKDKYRDPQSKTFNMEGCLVLDMEYTEPDQQTVKVTLFCPTIASIRSAARQNAVATLEYPDGKGEIVFEW